VSDALSTMRPRPAVLSRPQYALRFPCSLLREAHPQPWVTDENTSSPSTVFSQASAWLAVIRRDDEDVLPRTQLCKSLRQQRMQLRREISIDASRCTVQAHPLNSTFFNLGANSTNATSATR
jgi:hypothetical protein